MTALATELIEHLVLMATRAPSVHNTQPWSLKLTPSGMVVSRDRTRQLGAIDPEGREMLLSCGALLHHLQVAARAIGLQTTFSLNLRDDTVATIELSRGCDGTPTEIAAAVAILHRHTHRGRFDDDTVSTADLNQLDRAVEGQGGMLRVVRSDELTEVEVLLSRAEWALHQVDGYDAELSHWVWHGHDDERGDGMPRDAVDHGHDRAESLAGREFDGPVDRPAEPPRPERPTVVLLSSLGDGPADWVQSGRALSALLLAATEVGLLAQPLGQIIDLPASRHALTQLLGTVGSPQMLLRIGHGTSHPVTPRRPVADVLTAS
jgi:nitroreductase